MLGDRVIGGGSRECEESSERSRVYAESGGESRMLRMCRRRHTVEISNVGSMQKRMGAIATEEARRRVRDELGR